MATETFMKYCATCQRKTPHIKTTLSNVLHLLLTIVTVGLWLPVWIILGIRSGTARPACTICGNDTFLGMKVEPVPWWATALVGFVLVVVVAALLA